VVASLIVATFLLPGNLSTFVFKPEIWFCDHHSPEITQTYPSEMNGNFESVAIRIYITLNP
jgi:hypothetical protein